MTLINALVGEEYTIRDISFDDEELQAFLFSLGCYSGEKITAVAHNQNSCVISVKDSRYSIDNALAKEIRIEEAAL